MSDAILAAYIGFAGVLVSALLGGLFALRTRQLARRKDELSALRDELQRRLQDLITFRQLEERYLLRLAEETGASPETLKRETWGAHRDDGGERPSQQAELARLEERLRQITG